MSTLAPISKRRFGKIRALHTKKERLLSGLTILEGERLVVEALRNGLHIESAVGTEEFWARRMDLVRQFASAGITTVKVSDKQMTMLAVTEHSAGIFAIVSRPSWTPETFWEKVNDINFIGLMTVGVQDPGNLGTIIRTVAAAGGSGVLLGQGSAEIGSPKILRSSAGAVFKLPILENVAPLEILNKMKQLGVQTLASSSKKGRPYTALELTKPTLFVMGGEGSGLSEDILQACTQNVHIPMPGETESLNVAAASAIMIYEAVRQRRLSQALSRRK